MLCSRYKKSLKFFKQKAICLLLTTFILSLYLSDCIPTLNITVTLFIVLKSPFPYRFNAFKFSKQFSRWLYLYKVQLYKEFLQMIIIPFPKFGAGFAVLFSDDYSQEFYGYSHRSKECGWLPASATALFYLFGSKQAVLSCL